MARICAVLMEFNWEVVRPDTLEVVSAATWAALSPPSAVVEIALTSSVPRAATWAVVRPLI